jgi:hypothetical protein
MIHLPNHVYFSQLATIQPDTLGPTVTKVLVYSLLELCSLFLLNWMLRQRLRFSPLVQLSFVLDTHWKSVQAELVLWVVYIAQAPLEHYGKHIIAHMTALLDDNLSPTSLTVTWNRSGLQFQFRMASCERDLNFSLTSGSDHHVRSRNRC